MGVTSAVIALLDTDVASSLFLTGGVSLKRAHRPQQRAYLRHLLRRLLFPLLPVAVAVLAVALAAHPRTGRAGCALVSLPAWYLANLVLCAYPFCVLCPGTTRGGGSRSSRSRRGPRRTRRRRRWCGRGC